MKKFFAIILAAMMILTAVSFAFAETKTFTIGICNYVDDASLNQIVESIENRLAEIGAANDIDFRIKYDNCNANANDLAQIVANMMANKVDLMVGVATPVAMKMQAETQENPIPVVFAAVSDPISCGLVDNLEAPGANITGTSDYLDTTAVLNLIFALKPDAKKIGLLYDIGQDSSATPIAEAKAYLDAKGVAYVERTATNDTEVLMAAESLAAAKVDAVFTPTDNTIMASELAIYETLANAGIPHFTGADSFALNGAFLGYGVDYANLGAETANLVADILMNGKNAGEVPVMTFDNGTATVNTDICAALNLNYDDVAAAFAPYCTKVQPIVTADSFSDLQ